MVDVSLLTLWTPEVGRTHRSLARESGCSIEHLIITPAHGAPGASGSSKAPAPAAEVMTHGRSPSTLVRELIVATHDPLAALNLGLAQAQGRYAACLASGEGFSPGFLASAVRVLDEDPGIGLVAPQLRSPRGLGRDRHALDLGVQLIQDQLPTPTLFRRAALPRWDEDLGGHAFWDGWLGVLGQGLEVRVLAGHRVTGSPRRASAGWSPVPSAQDRDLPIILGRHRELYAAGAEEFWRAAEEQRSALMRLKRRYGPAEDLLHALAARLPRRRA